MQEAHGDGVHRVGNGREHTVERRDLDAAPVETTGHAEAERARHERRRPVDERVVQRRPHLARDLDLVDEAARRDQRDARAAPFEQRVGGDRRAVREHVDPTAAVDRVDRSLYGASGIVGRGSNLGDAPVVGDDIGERAATVDPDPHARKIYLLVVTIPPEQFRGLASGNRASGRCGSRDRAARSAGAGAARARRARCASARRPATRDRRASRG